MSNVSQEERVLREKQRERNEKFLKSLWKMETTVNVGILEGTHDAEDLKKLLQDFLEKKGDEKKDLVTLAQVINILGRGKVITAKQSAKALGKKAPKAPPILPSEEILRQCAKENEQGQDWWVIYCFADSMRGLRAKFGTDTNKQPCFYKSNDWWLKPEEDPWATKELEAGYYLINLRPQFRNMNWNRQEQEIAKLEKDERCHEVIFSEVILTIFKVKGERIAEDWWHWGISRDSGGDRVYVGCFDADGLDVSNYRDDYSVLYLSVVLVRKF